MLFAGYKSLLVAALGALTSLSAEAREYYVSTFGDDANPGTREAPWRTVEYASQQAVAGDTVLFMPGDYSGTLAPVNSGSADSPIVFKSAERRQARLIGDDQGRWSSGHGGRIRLHDVSHIEIRGFEIMDTAVDRSTGGWLWAGQSSYLVIADCGFRGGYRWAHFWMENTEHVSILDSDFERDRHSGDLWRVIDARYLLIEGNSFSKGLHTLVSLRQCRDVVLRGNIFHAGTGRNFETTQIERILVENNVFTHAYNGSWSAGSQNQLSGAQHILRYNKTFRNFGIPWSFGASSVVGVRDGRIYNNVFFGNHGRAMVANSNRGNFLNFILKNNLFVGNDPFGSWTQLAFDGGEGESIRVINNNFHGGDWDNPGLLRHAFDPLSLDQAQNTLPYATFFWDNTSVAAEFVDADAFNFALAPQSPLRTQGVELTRTRSAGSGKFLPVDDVFYFYDGFGIQGELGDMISVGEHQHRARIVNIDYGNRVLVLDRELEWDAAEGVGTALAIDGPAMGPYEYGETGRPSIQVVADRGVVRPGEIINFQAVVRGMRPPFEFFWQLGDGALARGESISYRHSSAKDESSRTEYPSWGNSFEKNYLVSNYHGGSLETFTLDQCAAINGCVPPSPSATRLSHVDNVHAPYKVDISAFQLWQHRNFPPSKRADPKIAGIHGNPSGDGIPNIIKYAMGLDPHRTYTPKALPQAFLASEKLNLSYTHNTRAEDIEIDVQVSGDLRQWKDADSSELEIVEVISDPDESLKRVTVRLRAPLESGESLFLRQKITLPDSAEWWSPW